MLANKWVKVFCEMMLGGISEFCIKSNSQALNDLLELLLDLNPTLINPWKDLDLIDGDKKQKKDKNNCHII